MTVISDASSCGITYERHSDDSRGVIYAPRVINNTHREYLQYRCHHDDRHMGIKM
jgi:hypothetical protein